MSEKKIAAKPVKEHELISIHVYYDKELSEIAGISEEKIGVPKGITSGDLVKYILHRHPKMEKKFKKKKLSFEHSAPYPKAEDVLQDNDVYVIATWTMQEMRQSLREMLEFALGYFAVPMTVNDVLSCIFFEEQGEADRHELLKTLVGYVDEPNLIPILYGLINQTWLFFPHHKLNGLSPVETVQKVVQGRLK